MVKQIDADIMLDKRVQKKFSRSSVRYDEYAVLPKIVSERLAQRLKYIAFSPRSILDIGCGTGILTNSIMQRYPGASIVAADYADKMLCQLRKKIIMS